MGEDLAPAQLFRYRGYSVADLSDETRLSRIVSEIERAKRGEVWFSPLSVQNDPFDTNPHYVRSPHWQINKLLRDFHTRHGRYASFSGMDLREEARRRGISTKALKATKKKRSVEFTYKSTEHLIKSHRDDSVICCFSQTAEDVLMWSYYSNSHASMCFRFECPEERRADARLTVGRVKYVTERPTITTLDIVKNMLSSRDPETFSATQEEAGRFTDAFILTKSIHWKHEAEWRALQPSKVKLGYHPIKPYRLTGVIFGCRAPLEFTNYITGLIDKNIEILRADIDESRYELSISK